MRQQWWLITDHAAGRQSSQSLNSTIDPSNACTARCRRLQCAKQLFQDLEKGDWLELNGTFSTIRQRGEWQCQGKNGKNGPTTLSHMNFSGYIRHYWLYLVAWLLLLLIDFYCCLVVGLGLDLVSGWLSVIYEYLNYSRILSVVTVTLPGKGDIHRHLIL